MIYSNPEATAIIRGAPIGEHEKNQNGIRSDYFQSIEPKKH
jgi:hypothetical protein